MLDAYLSWPRALREGYEAGLEQGRARPPARAVRGVVVCGMGGSGIVGDYAAALAEERGALPVYVVKGHRLPIWARDHLVVAVSFSGNTVETIECFRAARRVGAPLAVVASGGRLAEMAREAGAALVLVPPSPAARTAFAQLLGGLLGYLEGAGLLDARVSVEAAARLLEEGLAAARERASGLARGLAGRVPVILACREYEPLAWRFKNELNENAKVQAKVEVLPEWGHNDAEGWARPVAADAFAAVALDPREEPCRSLLEFALDTIGSAGAAALRLALEGEDALSRMLWGSLVAGLASLELARIRGVDPLETPMIRRFRERIGRLLAGEST